MYETGLVEEVKALFDEGIPAESQSIRAIGYKELYDYFKGLISLEESKELIKRNSRRYAKRQYTWFNIKWMLHGLRLMYNILIKQLKKC